MKYSMSDLNMLKIRKYLLEYYEDLYNQGVIEAGPEYAFIQNATDVELYEFIDKRNIDCTKYANKKR